MDWVSGVKSDPGCLPESPRPVTSLEAFCPRAQEEKNSEIPMRLVTLSKGELECGRVRVLVIWIGIPSFSSASTVTKPTNLHSLTIMKALARAPRFQPILGPVECFNCTALGHYPNLGFYSLDLFDEFKQFRVVLTGIDDEFQLIVTGLVDQFLQCIPA